MQFLSSLTSYGYAMHLCNHCSGDVVFSFGLSSFQQNIWGNAVFIMAACSPHLFGQHTDCPKEMENHLENDDAGSATDWTHPASSIPVKETNEFANKRRSQSQITPLFSDGILQVIVSMLSGLSGVFPSEVGMLNTSFLFCFRLKANEFGGRCLDEGICWSKTAAFGTSYKTDTDCIQIYTKEACFVCHGCNAGHLIVSELHCQDDLYKNKQLWKTCWTGLKE